ncbi:Thioredoxin reductase [hydrothermal vent metagenome]|uniref:Thioredoxin reductase n=1 Tax=hydrothermal vent metagenome TaxID=652676 RepID=A0A3B0UME6_9ZZZZ
MSDTNTKLFDLIIIGGGPAGISCGIYAARKQLSTLVLAETLSGQSVVSEGIENWIGTIKISGSDLAKAMSEHLNAYKGDVVEIREGTRVSSLSFDKDGAYFHVTSESGDSFISRAVFIGSGASRRKLNIPGADKFEHKGVTYCASCDGPLYTNADVAVIGGGNAGFETAAQLLAYAKSVTLVHRSKDFRADPITVKELLKYPNFRALTLTEPIEVKGDQFVTGLVVKQKETGETTTLPVTGVFVEIGTVPNTDFAKDILALDETNHIKVDSKTQRAYSAKDVDSVLEGVWAAGDCTDEIYHQNNIAAGDGVKASEDLYHWIATHRS